MLDAVVGHRTLQGGGLYKDIGDDVLGDEKTKVIVKKVTKIHA